MTKFFIQRHRLSSCVKWATGCVVGSCLEYGHSCWGAHGKRSGNNKIYNAKPKVPMEFDFQDLSGLGEKNNYDSAEEVWNAASNTLAAGSDQGKDVDDDDLVEGPDKKSIKFKKFLYKQLNKTSRNQRNTEVAQHHGRETNGDKREMATLAVVQSEESANHATRQRLAK